MKLFALCILTSCGTPSGPTQPYVATVGKGSGAPVDEVVVTVNELRNNDGTVRCFLYDDGAGFPDAATHMIATAVGLPVAHAAICKFAGVAPDHDYAIVILHDENNDSVFQKNVLGMPKEGYGFSNNAKARFSAPSYADCKFHFTSGSLPMTIATNY